jgi:hypothetical protein
LRKRHPTKNEEWHYFCKNQPNARFDTRNGKLSLACIQTMTFGSDGVVMVVPTPVVLLDDKV